MEKNSLTTVREISDRLTGDDFWHAGNLYFADGPSGLRVQPGRGDSMGLNKSLPATGFPTHNALACSWNVALAAEVGRRLGAEAAAYGVDVLLAPAVNIKRSPYNGRNFEYFSEDPYLSGEMGAAFVNGVQSTGVGACVKHFACNNKETGRNVSDSIVGERTLRELYLPAFERVVKKSAPAAVMTAYNKINGVYCSENSYLLGDVLRGEWGFKGFTVTDWGGTDDRVSAIKAGCDLEMPACKFSTDIIAEAWERGEISVQELETCKERILSAEKASKPLKVPADLTANARFAAEAAAECAVLLKNDGVLPLKKASRIAVFGRAAEDAPVQGGGSSHIIYSEKLKNLLSTLGERFEITGYFKQYKEIGRRAKKAISKSDCVVVCLAMYKGDSEGDDKHTLCLPEEQVRLVNSLKNCGKKVVCVLTSGGAVDTSWDASCDALLYLGLAGQGSAEAAADILCGDRNPSARLAESFFNSPDELPSSEDFHKSPYFSLYPEGCAVGYRFYLSSGVSPKYAFGYGLGYTTFSYSEPACDGNSVSVTLENTGDRDGGEVVQIYVAYPKAANPVSPVLAGFKKVFLKAGEKTRVEIHLEPFRSFDTSKRSFVTVGGEYLIHIANSSTNFIYALPLITDGEEGVPAEEFTGTEPPPYPIIRDKRGRVTADIKTPFCELTNSHAALVRLVSRGALAYLRKNTTVGGTLRYATIRMGAQFGGFDSRRKEGIVQLFNGKYLKGGWKFISKGKKKER